MTVSVTRKSFCAWVERGRGAQRRHRKFHAVLGESDNVHIALDHDHFGRRANRRPRLKHPVELARPWKTQVFQAS